jgi:hypothetical protein
MERNIVGISCGVHIVHNCVQNGCDTPPVEADLVHKCVQSGCDTPLVETDLVHRCVQSGCDTPPVEAEALVEEMYKCFTLSVTPLQQFCVAT